MIGGLPKTILVAPEDFPLNLPTPSLPPPGVIAGVPDSLVANATVEFIHIGGPSFQELALRYGSTIAVARMTFAPECFARTLAKMAFGAAIDALGLAPFTNTPIRNENLGADRNVGRWAGQWSGEAVNACSGLHGTTVRCAGTDIHVVVRPFAQFGGPEYHVVLGPADSEFVASSEWPWCA